MARRRSTWRRKRARQNKYALLIILALIFWPITIVYLLIKGIWLLIKAINSQKNVSMTFEETKKISNETTFRDFNYGSEIKQKSDFNQILLKKGEDFEDFVITLFNEYFEIMPRSESYPDYKIKFNPTREIFAIECKWKKTLSEDSFNIDERQLKPEFPFI